MLKGELDTSSDEEVVCTTCYSSKPIRKWQEKVSQVGSFYEGMCWWTSAVTCYIYIYFIAYLRDIHTYINFLIANISSDFRQSRR